MTYYVRTDVANKLRELLPAKWLIIDHAVALDNPINPVILVRQMSLARTAGGPRQYRDAALTIALVEPGFDVAQVERALDDDVELLVDALETIDIPGLIWTGADRVTFDDRFHGYDVHVTVTIGKD